MKMTWESVGGALIISFSGELDHHGAKEMMKTTARAIERNIPQRCVLDFKGVDFMDSSGIALLLNINKRIRGIGGSLSVENVKKQPMKVMRASAIDKILNVKELTI